MLKVIELFGGIGAFSKALERLNIEHKIIDYVELDKNAVKSYNAIHNTNFEPQDVRCYDKDIECDIIMHGSPCVSFSVVGRQKGGDKGSGTQSSLLYESLRIIDKIRPKYVIWENVKNLLSQKHKHTHLDYLNRMNKMGYTNYVKVMCAKDYGIPQNRSRVFTISTTEPFMFPKPIILKKTLKDMLEDEVDSKYYIGDAKKEFICKNGSNGFFVNNDAKINKIIARPLTTIQTGRAFETNYVSKDCGNEFIVTPNNVKSLNIRRLTPKECWRLMGFDDEDYERAKKVNDKDVILYKQAGNSIVVNILEAIIPNLIGGRYE